MATSNNYNPVFSRINLMNPVTVSVPNPFKPNFPIQEILLDRLSTRYVDIMKYLNSYTNYTWTGIKITTLSYQYYQTTTLWWLILMYNGLSHPLELTPGMLLKIPLPSQVTSYFSLNTAKTGTQIVLI